MFFYFWYFFLDFSDQRFIFRTFLLLAGTNVRKVVIKEIVALSEFFWEKKNWKLKLKKKLKIENCRLNELNEVLVIVCEKLKIYRIEIYTLLSYGLYFQFPRSEKFELIRLVTKKCFSPSCTNFSDRSHVMDPFQFPFPSGKKSRQVQMVTYWLYRVICWHFCQTWNCHILLV